MPNQDQQVIVSLRPITVWFCTKTGDAMEVSNASDEEYDYRECPCGAPLESKSAALQQPPSEVGELVERLAEALSEIINVLGMDPECIPSAWPSVTCKNAKHFQFLPREEDGWVCPECFSTQWAADGSDAPPESHLAARLRQIRAALKQPGELVDLAERLRESAGSETNRERRADLRQAATQLEQTTLSTSDRERLREAEERVKELEAVAMQLADSLKSHMGKNCGGCSAPKALAAYVALAGASDTKEDGDE